MRLLRISFLSFLPLLAFVAALDPIQSDQSLAAGNGTVTALPTAGVVAVGGAIPVSIVAEAPDSDLSIWIIEVWYDQAVVQVATVAGNPDCTEAVLPVDGVGASAVLLKDRNNDTIPDAIVALGGYVRNDGGNAVGLTGTVLLGTCNFLGIGSPGDITPLTVQVTSFVSPDSSEPTPTEVDGSIQLIAAPPTPSPTPVPTVPPVGGLVEVMTTQAGGDSTSPWWALLPALAATAFIARRRIMRR